MERKWFQAAAGLTWLALPLIALHYWRAWDRLPARMAVHFDVNWQPNGWTSRESALTLALVTTVLPLVIFTIAIYVAARRAAVSSLSRWSMVVVFYVALGFIYLVNTWIVDRNLDGRSTPFSELIVLRNLDKAKTGRTFESLQLHS